MRSIRFEWEEGERPSLFVDGQDVSNRVVSMTLKAGVDRRHPELSVVPVPGLLAEEEGEQND